MILNAISKKYRDRFKKDREIPPSKQKSGSTTTKFAGRGIIGENAGIVVYSRQKAPKMVEMPLERLKNL